MTAKNCIETKDLVKTFAGGKTTAVDHLSLTIEKGQTVGLIGADGAGKTTLLRLIGGLLLPDAGSLSVCGLDPVKDKGTAFRQNRLHAAKVRPLRRPDGAGKSGVLRRFEKHRPRFFRNACLCRP